MHLLLYRVQTDVLQETIYPVIKVHNTKMMQASVYWMQMVMAIWIFLLYQGVLRINHKQKLIPIISISMMVKEILQNLRLILPIIALPKVVSVLLIMIKMGIWIFSLAEGSYPEDIRCLPIALSTEMILRKAK